MSDHNLEYYIKNDLPLTKSVTNVEGSIFVTTDRHILNHDFQDDEILFVNGKQGYQIIPMNDLSARKALLTQFNKLMKKRMKVNVLQATHFAHSNIEIADCIDIGELKTGILTIDYDDLKDLFIDWATDMDRIGVMIQHTCELGYPPHIHLLYQRERGRCEEFQMYCEDNY